MKDLISFPKWTTSKDNIKGIKFNKKLIGIIYTL